MITPSSTFQRYCRQGQLRDEYDEIEPFFDLKTTAVVIPPADSGSDESSFSLGSPHARLIRLPPEDRRFFVDSLAEGLKLPPTIARMSTTEIGKRRLRIEIIKKLRQTFFILNTVCLLCRRIWISRKRQSTKYIF